MSANGKKTNGRSVSPDARSAIYVYCIAESEAARQIAEAADLPLLEAGMLGLVDNGGLTALSSEVPLDHYGEAALSLNMSQAGWLAPRAMKHEQVVEYFARRTSVVPLRFGTVYLERSGVERMLGEKHRELAALLERLRGKEEWGVNVYFDRTELLASITLLSPRLRELSAQADAAAPGQSYLLRKKISALRVDEVRAEIVRLTDATERTLQSNSDDLRKLRVLKVESTEHGELNAKFAVLIERARFESFHDSIESWARENQQAGMRLELTGPWPAYNFTSDESGK